MKLAKKTAKTKARKARYEVEVRGGVVCDEYELNVTGVVVVKVINEPRARDAAIDALKRELVITSSGDYLELEATRAYKRHVRNVCKTCRSKFWWGTKAAFCNGVCAEDYTPPVKRKRARA